MHVRTLQSWVAAVTSLLMLIAVSQAVAGPEMDDYPSSLSFGNVAEIGSGEQYFQISNHGDSILTVSFSITGPDNTRFAILDGNNSPYHLEPNTGYLFAVTFTPGSLGAKTATLNITSDDANESMVSVPLSGTGVANQYGSLAFYSAYQLVNEEYSVSVRIDRSGGSDGPVSVYLTTTPGTATSPADYTEKNHVKVDFANGQTIKGVSIPIHFDPASGPNKSFTVTLSDPEGGAILGTQTTSTIRIIDWVDPTKPKVTITQPVAGANFEEGISTVSITGNATDDKEVGRVQVSLNGEAFTDTVLVFAPDHKSASYSKAIVQVAGLGELQLMPGPNVITVKSLDTRNNASALVKRTFNYNVHRPLSLNVVGNGNITTLIPGEDLTDKKVGFTYSIVAKPGPGQVFAGWTTVNDSNTGITTESKKWPVLTFTHREGLMLTANFISNPFTPSAVGKFNGLVLSNASEPSPNGTKASNETVGFLSATVTGTGTFTGTLKIDGLTLPFAGVLSSSGEARFGKNKAIALILPRSGKPSLELTFSINLGTGKLIGAVVQKTFGNVVAVSDIDADRAAYSALNKVPDPSIAGTTSKPYVLLFKWTYNPNMTQSYYPQGSGFAAGTIKADGTVSFAGKLPDNTAITASAPLSSTYTWPLYTPLYGAKGSLSAKIAVDTTQSETDMLGSDAHWFRPYSVSHWYPEGWKDGIAMNIVGCKHDPLPQPQPASVLPGIMPENLLNGNARVTFTTSFGAFYLQRRVNISPTNVVSKIPVTDPLVSCTINAAKGLIGGSFTYTDGVKLPWQGAIFQKAGNHQGGWGYFMTPKPKVVDGSGQGGAAFLWWP